MSIYIRKIYPIKNYQSNAKHSLEIKIVQQFIRVRLQTYVRFSFLPFRPPTSGAIEIHVIQRELKISTHRGEKISN